MVITYMNSYGDFFFMQKLLNESRGMESARAAGGKSKSELLQHLLQLEDDEDDQRTPNAVSGGNINHLSMEKIPRFRMKNT